MPYATAQFLQDPLGFMEDNIIVPHHSDIGVDQRSARIHELCLSKAGAQGKRHAAIWMSGYFANVPKMIPAVKASMATGAPTIRMKPSALPSVTERVTCLPPPWMAAHLE